MSEVMLDRIVREMKATKKMGLCDFFKAEEIVVTAIRAAWPVEKTLYKDLVGATKRKYVGPTVNGILKEIARISEEYKNGAYKTVQAQPQASTAPTPEPSSPKRTKTTENREMFSPSRPTTAERAGAAAPIAKRARVYAPPAKAPKADTKGAAAAPKEAPKAKEEAKATAPSKKEAKPAAAAEEKASDRVGTFYKLLNSLFNQGRLEDCTVEQIEVDCAENYASFNFTSAEIMKLLADMEDKNKVMLCDGTVYRI
eukprot:CAMPEP_0118930016 /NCGR_PEP_ID=MMETSP1169-20130426/6845_1 /TAXON_ID=36882 /ORGANISM="Pyramimonas obovata, Strain CCMP722" /LENGTH=254 /DNA_ID=CAMNT_0006872305 /DNA_START=280 /DNA_END=1044 /DNA_ORIENTATION=-